MLLFTNKDEIYFLKSYPPCRYPKKNARIEFIYSGILIFFKQGRLNLNCAVFLIFRN